MSIHDYYKAAKEGDLNSVRASNNKEKFVHVDWANEDGRTALILAAREGHVDIVKFLIEAKADLDKADRAGPEAGMSGNTALLWAAKNNHADIVKLLIEAKADLDRGDNTGSTALGWAVHWNYTDVAKLLKTAGAKEYCAFSK